jgi:LacI family transcriptional regulator
MSRNPALPVVGIRIPAWATFTREIYTGVVDYMREHRRWRIETPLESTNELHPVVIDEHWRGDGLIVFRYTRKEAQAWLRRGIRVVNLSSECLDPRIPTVTPDNREAGRLAAQYLLELGFRRFAYWQDPERVYSCERFAGYSAELARHHFTCEVIGTVVHRMQDQEKADQIAAAMDRQIAKLDNPVALFTKDDLAAMHVVRSCARLGITVPDEVAVVGCNDDFFFCYTADTPISSVRYPGRLIGYRLAETLDGLFAGKKAPPERTLVPVTGVTPRESTNILVHAHPQVREALRIIRDESPKTPLHVQDLLARIPASNAALKRWFRDETGETMKEAIDRVRTEKIKSLLARSPLPIKVIAEEMKFESQEELSRFFKRTAGEAPSDFRTRHRAGSERFISEEER